MRAGGFEGRELRARLRLRMPHVTPLRWKQTLWKMMRAVGVPAVGEDLKVVGVAHGGMDQVDSVGADDTELSSFYNLLSFSHSFFPWCTLD